MRCEECGTEAPADARGWQGLWVEDDEADDPAEIRFWCPQCAYREFGDLRDRRRSWPSDD